jgi:hypothetical protein
LCFPYVRFKIEGKSPDLDIEIKILLKAKTKP